MYKYIRYVHTRIHIIMIDFTFQLVIRYQIMIISITEIIVHIEERI